MSCILLWSSAVRVHDSQAYRKMDVTRERISRILELREILLSIQTGFNLVNTAVVCAILEIISGLEPSSVITEPRYLKLVTVSSFCPFTLIFVLMSLVLFVISLVFSTSDISESSWHLITRLEEFSVRRTEMCTWLTAKVTVLIRFSACVLLEHTTRKGPSLNLLVLLRILAICLEALLHLEGGPLDQRIFPTRRIHNDKYRPVIVCHERKSLSEFKSEWSPCLVRFLFLFFDFWFFNLLLLLLLWKAEEATYDLKGYHYV